MQNSLEATWKARRLSIGRVMNHEASWQQGRGPSGRVLGSMPDGEKVAVLHAATFWPPYFLSTARLTRFFGLLDDPTIPN